MAVGPLLKSTSKMFNPSLLKKSFLSAMDSGRSESVGASTPMIALVVSAEKLWREKNTKPRKKLNKNDKQVRHLIGFPPIVTTVPVDAAELIQVVLSSQTA
jgi:hypothetical protein